MQVITLVSQKGGSGKTTIACCLAVAAQMGKRRVAICDMDTRQQSASKWFERRRSEQSTPHVFLSEPRNLTKEIKKMSGAADLIFLDTPGREDAGVNAAIQAADFCLIPCQSTVLDIEAMVDTAMAIKRLNTSSAFLLSQTPPRGFRIREAHAGLRALGTVVPIPIVHRVIYQDALGIGQGVTEAEPNGKAAQEIQDVWKWIAARL